MEVKSDDFRRWHWLRRNKSTRIPSNLLFVDTETRSVPIEGSPHSTLEVLQLWTAISCRLNVRRVQRERKHAGTMASEFWQLVQSLTSNSLPLWIFGHNLGFDLTVLHFWKELESGAFVLDQQVAADQGGAGLDGPKKWQGFLVINDPPTIIHCRSGQSRNTVNFVDTFNYFRTSVAELGKTVGLEKFAMPPREDGLVALERYCLRDVEIIKSAIVGLMKFVRSHDLGQWRYTSAAQAMSAYRHRFMHERLLVHGNKEATQLEREAYYGGRLEAFFIGDVQKDDGFWLGYPCEPSGTHVPYRYGPVYVVDVQSCYPSVMEVGDFPTRITGLHAMPSLNDLKEALQAGAVIARVTLQSLAETFPVRQEGRTVYARGRFVTALCGPELRRAINAGALLNVGLMATYDQGRIFADYVRYFWQLRQTCEKAGDLPYAALCKVLLNSLSGKFGQRSSQWQNDDSVFAKLPFGAWSQHSDVTGQSASYRSIGWHVQRELDTGEAIDSLPSIAAYITSYARELIESLRVLAGPENVYYIDTDSLHVNADGLARLEHNGLVQPGVLGKLALIGQYDTAQYRGLKDYSVGDNHVISGVKADAEAVRKGTFRQARFQRLPSILSAGPPIGVRVDQVTIDRTVGLRGVMIRADGRVDPPTLW